MRVSGRRVVVFAMAIAAISARGTAQAPDITPAGDPTVASDTIYRLAVDSAIFPNQSAVRLFRDGVVKIEPDGRVRRTYRRITQILRDAGAKDYGEQEFIYDADRERFSVNWVRVLKPTGEIISEASAHTQESDLPASVVNPVYVHQRSVRMSLAGVVPGTLVDVSWTIEELKTYRPGDFQERWTISGPTTLMRSRFLVDVPKDMNLQIREHHLNFSRDERQVGDRKVYTWSTGEVPWVTEELFAPPPDSNDRMMSVQVATPASWSDIGHWYAGLAADRLGPDPKLRATVKAIVATAITADDSVRAIQRWVSQDIRYVALELGIGGYQPRMPDTVIATGFGDCKDKASLFIAALRAINVDAYPVLLNTVNRPDAQLPTIGAFNHEIAAIRRPSGYLYVDLTSDISPYGTVPEPDRNGFALVVHPDGQTEQVTIPRDSLHESRVDLTVTATLTSDGALTGQMRFRPSGMVELVMRNAMRGRLETSKQAAFAQTMAQAVFPNASGDSLVTFEGRDLRAIPVVSLRVHDAQATQHSSGSDILAVRDLSARLTAVANQLQASEPRRMPIDTRAVVPIPEIDDVRITLPDGWKAHLPPRVSVQGPFGSYEATYRQEGRDLIITHAMWQSHAGILSKDHERDLVAWFRDAAKDRVAFIIIEHP